MTVAEMGKTKIDWANWTWNPVWGCLNKCPYCYARQIARRFAIPVGKKETLSRLTRAYYRDEDVGHENEVVEEAIIGRLYNFQPTWLESNFNKPFPKKPSVIFVNSMSDIAYWNSSWMWRVVERIRSYPQHIFIMLTKSVGFYSEKVFPKPANLKIGLTIDGKYGEAERHALFIFNFLNFEPLQAKIGRDKLRYMIDECGKDWVIIGAETGNRNGKVTPKGEWVMEIVDAAREAGVPVWMKDNLTGVMGGAEKLIREHPYRGALEKREAKK